MNALQFTTSYLLHIGAGNLHSVEMFAYLNGVTMYPKQLVKCIRAAYKQSKNQKTLVLKLNKHSL